MVPKGTVPFGTVLVCSGEPHAQESVGKAVNLGVDLLEDALGGEKMIIM